MRAALPLCLLVLACGKDPSGVKQPGPEYHDPEILFTMNKAYPDTAIMRWYRDSTPDRLLAQVEITRADSVCAFFLVTSGTPMYFDIGWKRHGVVSVFHTVGPFNPENPDDYDPYWSINMVEDTVAGSASAYIESHRTKSFCPVTVGRDSVRAP